MKIAILTVGTRGDVQPYVALAQGLQRNGHMVTVVTGKDFRSLVESYGVRFAAVEANFRKIFDSQDGRKILKANPWAIQRNLTSLIFPLIREGLQAFYEIARESDFVLYRPKTFADMFADQFPAKILRLEVVPVIAPTSAFPNPAFSGFRWLPRWLNKSTYYLKGINYQFFRPVIHDFRTANQLPTRFRFLRPPIVYGISELLLERPADWPDYAHMTGFWLTRPDEKSALDDSLEKFLRAGKPPVLITFGSMSVKTKQPIEQLILQAIDGMDERFILVKGWGKWRNDALTRTNNVHVISSAPFEQLFPRVKAVVHHGGIGTTASCLAAGKPMFICPVLYPAGDQWFWGEQAYRKGVAVAPVPLKKLTVEVFRQRVTELGTRHALYERAAQLAKQLQQEDGIGNAVRIIEEHLHRASGLVSR